MTTPLVVQAIADIERGTAATSWLIDKLWGAQAVGILGGAPKSCKSWLALELALSVATGLPALGSFAVKDPGAVLLFMAEDSPEAVRRRLEGLAAARQVALASAPIHLVLAHALRLDAREDRQRLDAAIAALKPRLLVLDPFVRIHAIDENSAQEVSSVLGFLRLLQRKYHLAVLVVHHARKGKSTGERAGQALRGSGDLWAWGDSNLFVRRSQNAVELSIEHRNAANIDPIRFTLECRDNAEPNLQLLTEAHQPVMSRSLDDRVIESLEGTKGNFRLDALRAKLRVRMQTLLDVLKRLETKGLVQKANGGWSKTETNVTNTG